MRSPDAARAPGGRRRRITGVVLAVSVTTATLGWIAGTQMRSPTEIALAAAPPVPSKVTAPVEYRELTSRLVTRGQVGFRNPFVVRVLGVSSGVEGGAAVVTRTSGAGQQVREGGVLFEVAGRPVMVLQGAVPMYRSLGIGDSGADVRQLRAALARLGLPVSQGRDRYDAAVQRAVQRLYRRLGYTPPQPTAEQQARVRAARASVRTARGQLLDAQDVPAETGPTDAGQVASAHRRAVRAVAAAQDTLADAQAEQQDASIAAEPRLPSGELSFMPERAMRVQELRLHVGDTASGEATVLTGSQRVVRATVDARSIRLVRLGSRATLDAGDGGAGHLGTILKVGLVKKGETGGTQGEAEIAAQAMPAALGDGSDVKVTIPIRTTGRAVLAVPLGALGAVPSGDAVVTVLRPDGSTGQVLVDTGLSADGLVEVRPKTGQLRKGDRVVIGRR